MDANGSTQEAPATKRYGLTLPAGERFWKLDDLFTYRYKGLWLVYLADGNGEGDDDFLNAFPTLRRAAEYMHGMVA